MIAAQFEAEASPEAHESLILRAQLTIKPNKTLRDYISRYTSLHNAIQRENCPSIDSEQIVVTFILRGLATRPSLVHIVPIIMINCPKTIKDLRMALVWITTLKPPFQHQQRPRKHQ